MITWYEATPIIGGRHGWRGRMEVDSVTPMTYRHYKEGESPRVRSFYDSDQLLRLLQKGYWVPSWDEDMAMDVGL